MNKKIIFAITIVVLVLVGAGGYFWWTKQGLTPEEKEFELKKRVVTNYEEKHPEYIHFKETDEGKIILENTKDKIKFEIPEGWKVELPISETSSTISLYSDKTTILEDYAPGFQETFVCKLATGGENIQYQSLEEVKEASEKNIKEWIEEGLIDPDYLVYKTEITKIENFDAFKEYYCTAEWGCDEAITILINGRMYDFLIMFTGGEEFEDYCREKLIEILKTVSIQ